MIVAALAADADAACTRAAPPRPALPLTALACPLQEEKIVLLACGWRHTVAVSAAGRVFSWGRGVNGQLGHGDERDLWVARLLLASPAAAALLLLGPCLPLALCRCWGRLLLLGPTAAGLRMLVGRCGVS
jgi:hypothetical protein